MKESHRNLINKSFGHLTINDIFPYWSGKRHNKNYRCKVFCSMCNKNTIINLRSILDGKAKACGCLNHTKPRGNLNKRTENLTSRKFGLLTAKSIDPSKTSRVFWICQCDCGKEKSVAAKHLKQGRISSCGCRHYVSGKRNPCWKGYEDLSGRQWSRIIDGAKERELEFEITIQDAWNLFEKQKRKCALSGINLQFGYDGTGNASLDRIDSSKGYVNGNIQWVDKRVNKMKMEFNQSEFIDMCKKISAVAS